MRKERRMGWENELRRKMTLRCRELTIPTNTDWPMEKRE